MALKIKISFFLLILILLSICIESLSYFAITKLEKSRWYFGIVKNYNDYKNHNYLKTEKYKFNPYIDHNLFLKKLDKKPKIYLRSELYKNLSNTKSKKNILFQGDSWSEAAVVINEISEQMNKFSNEINYNIFNAGKSSFSVSLYIAQLKILKKYYDIKPNIIVLIIDQTDLGDDLYRRSYFYHLPTELTLKSKKNLIGIIESKNFNFLKIFKIFYFYTQYTKKNYNLTTFQNLNFLKKKIESIITSTPLQMMPIKKGITIDQEKYFYELLKIYYDLANDKSLKKLIIVTHPHKNHLNNKYKSNLSKLVDQFILKNKIEKKVEHLNFKNYIEMNRNIINKVKFQKDDPYSHLTKNSYIKYFYPKILEEVKKTIFKLY